MKLNITVIVQMSGKIRAALNQSSYNVMTIRIGKAATKILFSFRKKTKDLLFLRFYTSGHFEGGTRGKCHNAFLLNSALLRIQGYFLPLIPYVKLYKMSLLAAETCALILDRRS